ncbi:MAG: hypothetical protein QOG82_981 [Actinomycetota bacterium]|nr:hypothetical protein [Actinomycetota bacterium]
MSGIEDAGALLGPVPERFPRLEITFGQGGRHRTGPRAKPQRRT